uniref:Uncharacterized protein n=1 Tax=Rhizophora mucronata TaxID=61149 RepID=A0A2P2L6S7_RHIMU
MILHKTQGARNMNSHLKATQQMVETCNSSRTSSNPNSTRTRCLTRLTSLPRLSQVIPAPEKTLWRLPVPTVSARANPHYTGVDGTRHTVLHLHVQLRKNIPVINASLLNIPNGSLLDDVPHKKSLDRLVLGAGLAAVGAAYELDVAAAVLVASAIPSLESHDCCC